MKKRLKGLTGVIMSVRSNISKETVELREGRPEAITMISMTKGRGLKDITVAVVKPQVWPISVTGLRTQQRGFTLLCRPFLTNR